MLAAGAGAVAGDAGSSVDGANAEAVGADGVAVDIIRAGVVIVDAAGGAGRGSYAVGGDGPAGGICIPDGCGFAAGRGLVFLRRGSCGPYYYCLRAELVFF